MKSPPFPKRKAFSLAARAGTLGDGWEARGVVVTGQPILPFTFQGRLGEASQLAQGLKSFCGAGWASHVDLTNGSSGSSGSSEMNHLTAAPAVGVCVKSSRLGPPSASESVRQ